MAILGMSFSCFSFAETENVMMLKCDNSDFIEDGFLYPVDVTRLSDFYINEKTKLYQFDLLIDPNFKFPKENIEGGFTPSYSKKQEIVCFNDELPKLTSEILI